MPKCAMEGCESHTRDVRGVAAAQGWFVADLQGKRGNKYLNICPEHQAKEILKAVNEAAKKCVSGDE